MDVTIKVTLVAYCEPLDDGSLKFNVCDSGSFWLKSDKVIKLLEFSREFRLANFSEDNLRHQIVATLTERKANILAKARQEADQLQEKIGSMLALTHDDGTSSLDISAMTIDDIPF